MNTNLTERDLQNARECIQEDLLALMDGLPEEAQTRACDIVCQYFKPLMAKVQANANDTKGQ